MQNIYICEISSKKQGSTRQEPMQERSWCVQAQNGAAASEEVEDRKNLLLPYTPDWNYKHLYFKLAGA